MRPGVGAAREVLEIVRGVEGGGRVRFVCEVEEVGLGEEATEEVFEEVDTLGPEIEGRDEGSFWGEVERVSVWERVEEGLRTEEGAGGGGIEEEEEDGRVERVRDGGRVEEVDEEGRAEEGREVEEGRGGVLNVSS